MQILKYGSTGPYVQMLQLALSRSLRLLKKDGVFGPATQSAVKDFQRTAGLAPDGIVGPLTRAALEPYLTGYKSHRIVPGDTFFRLAQRYGTTVRALETANPGLSPVNLPLGRTIVVPLSFEVVPDDISFTHALLEYCVKGLKGRYPFLRTGSIGKSVLGKSIPYISLGRGTREVFFNASHHANEWITTPVLMKFTEDYCREYAGKGSLYGISAADAYDRSTLYTVPMVNPDGVDLVTGASAPGSSAYETARKTAADYPSVRFPDGWKANISGTDLNLNYPALWERAKEIKYAEGYVSPAPRDFVGLYPLSAPESRAVYDFTRQHDFDITLSYHTQGNVIYWKFLDIEPAGAYAYARRFSQASGYYIAAVPYESGFAGYKDWFIYDYNRPGFTIEAGLGDNPLPISQFSDIYSRNTGILTSALIY